jgi:hypothetical protein
MMRGRIGNKGGVGISLKIAGTTLLFINAHLAGRLPIFSVESRVNFWKLCLAHEDHVSERLANYDRIKVVGH